jgi:hypothetical protein
MTWVVQMRLEFTMMKKSVRWLSAGVLWTAGVASVAGLAMPAAAQPKRDEVLTVNPEITRRGEGSRRLEMTKLELKPFAADAFGKLTDWTNGSALANADFKGKVVLVVTYSSWFKPAAKVVETARSLAETYAKKDLIVVAVHDKDGWAEAEKTKSPDGAKFLLAHDAKNEFRKGLSAGQDPEIYLIDRAGQLRYAGISSDVMETAVKKLTDEKAADAAKINDMIAAERARLEAEARRTTGAADVIDMTRIPDLGFNQPSDSAYEAAKWPLPPMSEQEEKDYRKDGKLPATRTVSLPTEGWIGKVPNLRGRITVVIFFHPDAIGTRFNTLVDSLSQEQARTRDVVYTMAVINPSILAQNSGNSNSEKKYETDPEKVAARLENYRKERKVEFPFFLDMDNLFFDSAKPEHQTEWPTGAMAVISTDGVMRWFGEIAAYQSVGLKSLNTCILVDPAVIARREAEAKWLAANKDKSAPAKK